VIGFVRPQYLYFPFVDRQIPFVFLPSGPSSIVLMTHPVLLCVLLASYVEAKRLSKPSLTMAVMGVPLAINAGVCEEVQYRWLSTPVYMVVIELLCYCLGANMVTNQLTSLKQGYDALTFGQFSKLMDRQYSPDQQTFVFALVLSDIEFCTIGSLALFAKDQLKSSVVWEQFLLQRFGLGTTAYIARFVSVLLKPIFAVWGRWVLYQYGFGALIAVHVWWDVCLITLPHAWKALFKLALALQVWSSRDRGQ
jgi:hypothetical protein